MTEISISDDVVRGAFADALAMPADTGSDFFADLRLCLRQSLVSLMPGQGVAVSNTDKVGRRSRQIAEIREITPLKHYSAMYKQEYVIDGEFCFGYGFDEDSLGAVDYVCGGKECPSLLPFRTVRQFSVGNIAINTGEVTDVTIAANQTFRVAGVAHHNGTRKTPGPFLAFLGIHFDFDRLQPLLDQVMAALPPDYLTLDEVQSCSTPVLWIARDTGNLFTCRCFDGAYTHRNEWTVRDNLCCLCTKRIPRTKCGHQMYFTPFQQTWRPYFPIFRSKLLREHPDRYLRTEDIKTLDRDAENTLREFIGHPVIGEKWQEETELFRIVSALLSPLPVIHHHKGDELLGLEYDIYVPDIRLAIEYHGEQHFQSIAHWGGEEGLAKRKENDSKKQRLSVRHGIDLVEFTHRDKINTETVSQRLRPFLDRISGAQPDPAQNHAEANRAIREDADRNKARRQKRSQIPTLWRPHLKPDQVELVTALLDWGCTKLTAQEGFSVLGILQRDDGNSMVKFAFDTVKEGLTEAQREIAADNTVRFYALAVHCTVQEPDEERPKDGFMVATEREGLLSSLFVFFEFVRAPDGSSLSVNSPRECYRTDEPLLRVNRAYNASALRQIGLGSLLGKKPE